MTEETKLWVYKKDPDTSMFYLENTKTGERLEDSYTTIRFAQAAEDKMNELANANRERSAAKSKTDEPDLKVPRPTKVQPTKKEPKT